ncbi:MAG: sialidase family protein [Prolixibacteraceae bacterium]
MQVPVLKLKKNNPLLQIRILARKDKGPFDVTSFHLTLNGTTDLNDIKTVRLYYVGNDSLWNMEADPRLFGQEKKISADLIIKGKQPLIPGENYFLLTCELADNANLQNMVDAGCLNIGFSGNSYVKPGIVSPPVKQRIGVAVRQHLDENVDTYRIPGLARTNKGTLLAIYDVRRDSPRDLQGNIDIGVSRSTDRGNTWEPMSIALDMGEWGGLPQKFNGVADACILADTNSDNIFISGCWMHGVLDKNGKWIEGLTEQSQEWQHQWFGRGSQPRFDPKESSQFLLTKSTNDGKDWSKPTNLTRMLKQEEWWLLAPSPGHGITLSDGTLVFPSQGRDSEGVCFSNITFSKDGGKTWETSRAPATNTTESTAVQLNDGKILLNMRDNRNSRNQSASNGRAIYTTNDMGNTWTEHPTSHGALIESTCMASLHKHHYKDNQGKDKSILLFSNPNTKTGRHHMTIKISFDDGNTWPEKYWLLLDEGNSRGYSCLTSVDEKTIGILYEGSQADITFQRIPLSELLNPNRNQ